MTRPRRLARCGKVRFWRCGEASLLPSLLPSLPRSKLDDHTSGHLGQLMKPARSRLVTSLRNPAVTFSSFQKVIQDRCHTANLLSALGYRRLPQREDRLSCKISLFECCCKEQQPVTNPSLASRIHCSMSDAGKRRYQRFRLACPA